MRTITIQELDSTSIKKLMDVEETAVMLNLLHPVEVNEFIESYTLDFTDLEMVCEIINELNLPFAQVRCKDGVKFINTEVLA